MMDLRETFLRQKAAWLPSNFASPESCKGRLSERNDAFHYILESLGWVVAFSGQAYEQAPLNFKQDPSKKRQ